MPDTVTPLRRGAHAEASQETTQGASEGYFEVDQEEFIFNNIMSCLGANHANTLAELEVLRACREERPYREVEDEVAALPVMGLTQQSAHTLVELLVAAGGLERIPVEDPQGAELEGADALVTPDDAKATIAGAGMADAVAELEEAGEGWQPVVDATYPAPPSREGLPEDYRLALTPAGRRALDEYEPTKRFQELVADEPATYLDAYRVVLEVSAPGAKRADIEGALRGHPALSSPKTVYAGYFISRLETVNGIEWRDGCWNTTAYGRQMRELCGQARR